MVSFSQSRRTVDGATLAAGGALILALAWLGNNGAQLVWTLLPAPTEQRSAAPASLGPAATPTHSPQTNLAALHLFGQAGAHVRPAPIEAPETQLNLTLLGTLAGAIETDGMAIIADEDGQQAAYAAGAEVPGGATLVEIHADRVVLDRDGVRESLRLNRSDSVASGVSNEPGASADSAGRAGGSGLTPGALSNPQVNPQRLGQLARDIRALPFTQNGRQVGVRLFSSGAGATTLSRLGLRSSDIVLAVNDVPLDDPGRQLELMNLMRTQSNFRVRIQRNGREMTLNIDANKLNP